MKNREHTNIIWRDMTDAEKKRICAGIMKNNLKCLGKAVLYSIFFCILLDFLLFIHGIYNYFFLKLYLLSILVYFCLISIKCVKILSGKLKCCDAVCYGRGETYEHTLNGFSYMIKCSSMCSNDRKRVFLLPAYKNTLFCADSGDEMLVLKFSAKQLRCFSKKELQLEKSKPQRDKWQKPDVKEMTFISDIEKDDLAVFRIAEAVVLIGEVVLMLIIILFTSSFDTIKVYALTLILLGIGLFLYKRIHMKKINKLENYQTGICRTTVVSCFYLKKPSGRVGYDYIYYRKIMLPESGIYWTEKLPYYSKKQSFDNKRVSNIIVVDYGGKRKKRDMKYYIVERNTL